MAIRSTHIRLEIAPAIKEGKSLALGLPCASCATQLWIRCRPSFQKIANQILPLLCSLEAWTTSSQSSFDAADDTSLLEGARKGSLQVAHLLKICKPFATIQLLTQGAAPIT